MLASILIVIYGLSFLYAWLLTQIRLHPEIIKTEPIYKHPNVNSYHERLPLIAFNMLCVFATAIIMGNVIGFMFSFTLDVPWWSLALQIVFMAFMDDIWFYFAHRWMHENEWLFRKVHSIHHRVRSTLPLDYIYVHPFEWMFGGFGIPLACAILYFTLGSINVYAFIIFGAFKVFHEINIHSGIKSIVLERHPFKFFGSSEHHGNHHFKIKGNYASCFKYLDNLLRSKLS
jgi:sterol desaturase/sphingolipid hydroxylase (fatty acid hydroxylase superfamily)